MDLLIEIILGVLAFLAFGFIITAPDHPPYSHDRGEPTTDRPEIKPINLTPPNIERHDK